MKGWGKMRYRWKKAFLLLGLLMMCGLSFGCQDTAVLYDSEEKAGDALLGDSGASGPETPEKDVAGGEASGEPQPICVYVCGEVRAPGVYELREGDRIVDAVEAAGGTTEAASDTWLNLAEPVSDGQKIEVPSREQAEELEEENRKAQSGLVNLNTASTEELMTLAGIGQSKAEAILSYREEHGGFEKPEDLMEIPGIKEGVFEKIKDQITV